MSETPFLRLFDLCWPIVASLLSFVPSRLPASEDPSPRRACFFAGLAVPPAAGPGDARGRGHRADGGDRGRPPLHAAREM